VGQPQTSGTPTEQRANNATNTSDQHFLDTTVAHLANATNRGNHFVAIG
jgi:hypothetical protein